MFPAETKILIVDDMVTMRKIVRKSLKDLGYTNVEEANDGDVAWDLTQKVFSEGQGFELIISDWNMPKMKGIDFLKQVRAHGDDALKATPFMLLTAEAEKDQIISAIKAGTSSYILKPFTPVQLKEKMDAVWARLKQTAA